MAWVRARLCKLQKRCTRLAAASDKFTSCLSTKTVRQDIAEILFKVALNTINQIKSLNVVNPKNSKMSVKIMEMI
jgi:hypothetical protein